MFKRLLLFVATNILVVATISIITTILGLHGYLTANGLDYRSLAIFCALWGTVGSFIALLLSKVMAKAALGVVVINAKTATREEQFLLEIVQNYTRRLQLPQVPEVGIYRSPELNAFATGPSKSNALVAVSSGLLNNMRPNEIDGVIGHEMTHIANGDMVTMTLLQGVVNAFSLFLSRVIAYFVSMALVKGEEREESPSFLIYNVLIIFFDILFTLLGSLVVAAFSRWREYRADSGGAVLAGRDNMIAALYRLQNAVGYEDDRAPSVAALKIAHKPSWFELFSSHPPLDKRIERLRYSDSR
jgi:heat shock protein HtpX